MKKLLQNEEFQLNEILFANRNKEYGAYVIRRDYDREMVLILLGIVLTITTAYGSYLFFKSDTIALNPKTFFDDPIPYDYYPPSTKIEIEKLIDKPVTVSKTDMAKSKNYVVTDDLTKGQKIDLLDNDKIQGPVDLKGKEGSGFTNPTGGGSEGGGTGIQQKKIEVPTADPDVYAEYPGGRDKMIKYLTSNLNYPEIARQLGIQGKCYLQFVINKQGEISNIKIVRSVSDCVECDQEAVRVIQKMPKWKPAIKDGQKVDSYFMMPINFSLR